MINGIVRWSYHVHMTVGTYIGIPVIFHLYQEAARQLRLGRTSVEQRGACVRKILFRHEIVCFNNGLNVTTVDTDSDTH